MLQTDEVSCQESAYVSEKILRILNPIERQSDDYKHLSNKSKDAVRIASDGKRYFFRSVEHEQYAQAILFASELQPCFFKDRSLGSIMVKNVEGKTIGVASEFIPQLRPLNYLLGKGNALGKECRNLYENPNDYSPEMARITGWCLLTRNYDVVGDPTLPIHVGKNIEAKVIGEQVCGLYVVDVGCAFGFDPQGSMLLREGNKEAALFSPDLAKIETQSYLSGALACHETKRCYEIARLHLGEFLKEERESIQKKICVLAPKYDLLGGDKLCRVLLENLSNLEYHCNNPQKLAFPAPNSYIDRIAYCGESWMESEEGSRLDGHVKRWTRRIEETSPAYSLKLRTQHKPILSGNEERRNLEKMSDALPRIAAIVKARSGDSKRGR